MNAAAERTAHPPPGRVCCEALVRGASRPCEYVWRVCVCVCVCVCWAKSTNYLKADTLSCGLLSTESYGGAHKDHRTPRTVPHRKHLDLLVDRRFEPRAWWSSSSSCPRGYSPVVLDRVGLEQRG